MMKKLTKILYKNRLNQIFLSSNLPLQIEGKQSGLGSKSIEKKKFRKKI